MKGLRLLMIRIVRNRLGSSVDGGTSTRPTEPADCCLAAQRADHNFSAGHDDATFADDSESAGHVVSTGPQSGDASASSESDRGEPSAERDHATFPDASEPDDGRRTSADSRSGDPCASSDDSSTGHDCYAYGSCP